MVGSGNGNGNNQKKQKTYGRKEFEKESFFP
jgi:hypothetical protein